jgi:hypothetical protein
MAKLSSTEFIVTIIMGVLLIMAALYFGTADLKPFEGTSKSLIEYPYEGFENAKAEFETRAHETPVKKPDEKPDEKIKVEGFSGLMGSALAETSSSLGFLAMNEGSSTCPGYGYTKSTGNVCMSAADLQLLKTRGGNATGA